MKNIIKKYYKPINMFLLCLLAIAFIISIWHLYATNKNNEIIYTVSNISSHLVNILWLIIICIIYNILGLLFKFEKKEENHITYEEKLAIYKNNFNTNDISNEQLNKIKKNRIILKIIIGFFTFVCIFITLLFVFAANNYTQDGNKIKEIISLSLKMLPWILTLFACIFAYIFINEFFNKKEYEILSKSKLDRKKKEKRNKKDMLIISVRYFLLTFSVVLIIVGVVNDNYNETLNKAIQICLECIGIG